MLQQDTSRNETRAHLQNRLTLQHNIDPLITSNQNHKTPHSNLKYIVEVHDHLAVSPITRLPDLDKTTAR